MREVARWLRANTAPDDRVLVWGGQASIYFRSGRRPASRFVTNVPLRFPWSAKRARDILRREIESTPPAAIIVSRKDRVPAIFGHRRAYHSRSTAGGRHARRSYRKEAGRSPQSVST